MARISAVLINYNYGTYLPQALDAALNQTVPFDEVIIVDDGSTDNSVSIIESRIHNVPQARLIKNPQNMGVIKAIDIGLQAASGDFIFYISADDQYSLQIVEQCRQALAQYPDVAMVSGNARICNVDTGKERAFTLPFAQQPARYTRADIEPIARKRNFTFYGGANLIRRDAMVQAGGQLAALKWHADWFLYLVIACRHPFAIIPLEYIRLRQSSNQYSHACYDWKQQRPVIESFIRTLRADYPQEYDFFRKGGLMPLYQMNSLWLLLRDGSLRHYLTPLLVWRLLTYTPLQKIGRLLPDGLRAAVRTLLRV